MVKHLNHLFPSIRRNTQVKIGNIFQEKKILLFLLGFLFFFFPTHLNLCFSSRDIACPWLHNTPSSVNKYGTAGIVVVWQDRSNIKRTTVLLSDRH